MKKLRKSIMMSMKDAKEGYSESHKVVWQTINYKAQPEKVVPAKKPILQEDLALKNCQKKIKFLLQ